MSLCLCLGSRRVYGRLGHLLSAPKLNSSFRKTAVSKAYAMKSLEFITCDNGQLMRRVIAFIPFVVVQTF